ncbi:sensor domain-containing diguanylate cyclase [Deinococcus terrestris]|uniref:sensor domain-containing diguanylate cyclase n=1 Tax=Deinococcus terrestris TaxID=2651870 RepID=UPI00128B74FC|nr:sensor domain-containing diguanylate cyclase [Deinococcus terrestris]
MSSVPPPPPSSEPARLAALTRYRVLGTPPEASFNRVTRLAAQVLGVPLAAVNLVGEDHQWTKACLGGDVTATALDGSFCVWAVRQEGAVLVVPDARQDPRFRDFPSVRSGVVVAYAGAPLVTPDGHRIGTLCVTAPEPRDFTPAEQETLELLAEMVVDELELRLRTEELTRARDHAHTLRDLAELMGEPLGPGEMARRALRLLGGAMRLDWAGLLHLSEQASEVLSDLASAPAARFGAEVRWRLLDPAGGLRATLLSWERVFLDDAAAVTERCPELLGTGLASLAWLHVQVEEEGHAPDGAYVLLLARLGEPAAWLPEERLLLEAAARSVGVALERAEHLQALERAALTDALTGLGNRRALDDALDDADARFADTGEGYVLGVVDLDGMKRVNDERGHASGDDLLREFALGLPAPGLHVYRLGGDEYALLAPVAPGEDPRERAELLRRQVQEAVARVQEQGYPADASLGVAAVPGDAGGATAALRRADACMYADKRERGTGRDTRRDESAEHPLPCEA